LACAPKIWIDLDNTPHVPFFEPLIEALRARGFRVALTARDAFQVCELADQKGLHYTKVGTHHGRCRWAKALGLAWRAAQLAPFVLQHKPQLAVSHGARAQLLVCGLLRVPTVLIDDYEFSAYPRGMRPDWQIVPLAMNKAPVHCRADRIRHYRGIKEDVYASRFQPRHGLLERLGIRAGNVVVTARPPATEAHYHNRESEELFARFMERACQVEGIRVVLLPRNRRQEQVLRQQFPRWFTQGRAVVPAEAVDGLDLLWHSDLVVSGGGTMNREAAALGVPVYSVFRGNIGAVDCELERQGRLVLISSPEELEHIPLVKRSRAVRVSNSETSALADILRHLSEIADSL
jgi:uncharacterized protein